MDNAFAVVPIFVNAGAAILPAVVGAAGSVLGVLFHPRELLSFCRRRPAVVLVVLIGVACIVAAGALLAGLGPPAAARRSDDPSPERIDWAKVAKEIINLEEIAARGGALRATAPTGPARPFIYRHGPSRCGYDGGPVPRKLMPRWDYSRPHRMYLSSPAVVGNRLFGASCIADPVGFYGEIFCLDAESGRKRWSSNSVTDPRTGEKAEFKPFFSSPAVTADGKYLVIGQGFHQHEDCSLLCFRAETGKLHWQVATPLHIEGSPAVLGDLAIAGAGAIEAPDGEPTGDPGFVLAVRISDGKELWRHPVRDPESSPAISEDGICYIGSGVGGNELVALRTDGDEALKARGLERVLWRARTPYPATGAVTLWDDLVIVGCGKGNYIEAAADPAGAVIAFDRHTGREVWQTAMPAAVLAAVAVDGKKAVCPVRNGQVIALALSDGREIWTVRVHGDSPVLAAPVLAGRTVYAVSRDGYLAVIDARDDPAIKPDDRLLEKHYLNDEAGPGEGRSFSSPIVAGARLYVGSETGGLRCFVGTEADK